MKKIIKASRNSLVDSVNKLSVDDAINKLEEVQRICGKFEDYYFGEDVVVYFTRCYEFCDKALNQLNKANSKI